LDITQSVVLILDESRRRIVLLVPEELEALEDNQIRDLGCMDEV
jgi:hypothetical protein